MPAKNDDYDYDFDDDAVVTDVVPELLHLCTSTAPNRPSADTQVLDVKGLPDGRNGHGNGNGAVPKNEFGSEIYRSASAIPTCVALGKALRRKKAFCVERLGVKGVIEEESEEGMEEGDYVVNDEDENDDDDDDGSAAAYIRTSISLSETTLVNTGDISSSNRSSIRLVPRETPAAAAHHQHHQRRSHAQIESLIYAYEALRLELAREEEEEREAEEGGGRMMRMDVNVDVDEREKKEKEKERAIMSEMRTVVDGWMVALLRNSSRVSLEGRKEGVRL